MFLRSFSEWNFSNMIIRIVVALFLGALIGIDRESKRRVAGLKTNSIVCLGAALVMMTAQYMESQFPGQADMARMAAQVISGVGFLGVGTIIVSGRQVKGLTTAASLWACACIGIAVGIGFIDGGVIVTLCLLNVFWVFPRIEEALNKRSRFITLTVAFSEGGKIAGLLHKIEEKGIKISTVDYINSKKRSGPITIHLILRLPYPARDFNIDEIAGEEGVLNVEVN